MIPPSKKISSRIATGAPRILVWAPRIPMWAPRIVLLGSKDRLFGLQGSSFWAPRILKGWGGCFLKGSKTKREQIKNEFRALSELVTSLPQPLNLSISQSLNSLLSL